METFYESKFLTISYIPSGDRIEVVWTKESSFMRDENFKVEISQVAAATEKYRQKNILADTLNFGYAVSPEVQIWHDANIIPRYVAVGLKKVAFIIPTDLLSHLGLEQTMDENQATQIITHYYGTRKEAIQWLNS